MKRLRFPIDRHADGQLTEVLRKIVLVVRYRRLMQLDAIFCCGALVGFWRPVPIRRHVRCRRKLTFDRKGWISGFDPTRSSLWLSNCAATNGSNSITSSVVESSVAGRLNGLK